MPTYVVSQGDTLSGIAAKYGTTYQALAAANGIANPNLIYPGQTFNIPGNTAAPAAPAAPKAPAVAPVQQPQQTYAPQQQPQATGGLTADVLRSKFGFNDPNVINNILNNPSEVARYTREAGLGAPGANTSAPAPFDLVGATNAAYNTPELKTANDAITAANTKLTQRQQALADAQAGINDNPFYSEATRVGKSAKLNEKANADMVVIQNEVQQAQNQVAQLKSDAQIKVNAALGQYNINRQAYQDTLDQFNTILKAGGLTNATPQDLANYAAQTGMSYSVLQSIQQQEQQDNIKTQILTSTDNAGNVTLTTVDTKTGNIINQTQAGQIDKAEKQTTATKADTYKELFNQYAPQYNEVLKQMVFTGGDSIGKISPENYNAALADWVKKGLNQGDFTSEFKKYVDPNYVNQYNGAK